MEDFVSKNTGIQVGRLLGFSSVSVPEFRQEDLPPANDFWWNQSSPKSPPDTPLDPYKKVMLSLCQTYWESFEVSFRELSITHKAGVVIERIQTLLSGFPLMPPVDFHFIQTYVENPGVLQITPLVRLPLALDISQVYKLDRREEIQKQNMKDTVRDSLTVNGSLLNFKHLNTPEDMYSKVIAEITYLLGFHPDISVVAAEILLTLISRSCSSALGFEKLVATFCQEGEATIVHSATESLPLQLYFNDTHVILRSDTSYRVIDSALKDVLNLQTSVIYLLEKKELEAYAEGLLVSNDCASEDDLEFIQHLGLQTSEKAEFACVPYFFIRCFPL